MGKQFKNKMGIESNIGFSNGWVQRFKLRNNISLRKYEGEASSANVPAINIELLKIKEEINKYNLDDVLNFDECALFYRLEPDKTLATKRLSGRKKNKERITIGLCSNAAGTTKLKPIVIGKCKCFKCFKNVNIKNMGILYTYNASAWMTGIIFRDWLSSLDKKFRIKKRNILLIIDNASCLNINNLELTNIKVLFLPPNTTSHLQPLDNGIIAAVKKRYKTKQILYIIKQLENNVLAPEKISLLQAIKMFKQSWDEITDNTIMNCWFHSKLIDRETQEITQGNSDQIDLQDLIDKLNLDNPMNASEFINFPDENLIEEMNLDDIIKMHDEKECEKEEEEEMENSIVIKPSQAPDSINLIINFLQQKNSDLTEEISYAEKIKIKILKEKQTSQVQKSITDYFNSK